MKNLRLALLVFSLAAAANAQEMRATLSGTVMDPTGARIAGATVSVRNTSTNLTATTSTGAAGGYVLPQLPAGPYELNVEAAGFRKYSRSGIELAVAGKAVVDVTLEVGTVADSVTVTAALTGMEANESVTGQLLDNREVMALPMSGRNFVTALSLSAGVVFTPKVGPNSGWNGTRQWESGPYAGAFTIHGGGNNSNSTLINGAPMGIEGGVTWIPLTDGIEEMKVSTPTSDASLGLSGGGVVNIVMKSGTNEYHGVLSEFIRNTMFEALQTQLRRVGTKAAQHQWNSFSAVVSGPIIKNKFFFSGGYDGYRERSPWSNVISVPSMAERSGDFTQTFNAAGQMIQIYDPLTTRVVNGRYIRDPFGGNKLPAERISTISKSLTPFWPEPDTAGDAFTHTRNYVMVAPGALANDAWHSKFDYNWSDKHRTSATVTQNWGYQKGSRSGFAGGSPANTGTWPESRIHHGAILDHTWSATPTLVATVRLSWDRWAQFSGNQAAWDFDGSKLGFQGAVSPFGYHFPRTAVDGMATMGINSWVYYPQDLYTVGGDVSKTIGRHLLKMGGRVIEGRYPYISLGAFLSEFFFTTGYTQRDAQLLEPTSGYGYASFLLGYPSSGDVNWADTMVAINRTYSSYIQDDFKLSQKLTLNFGLRWDIQAAPFERMNRAVRTFDPNGAYSLNGVPAKGGLVFTDSGHRTRYDTHYRDFQPRLGVAYQARKNLVFRASYGLSFLPNNQWGGLGGTNAIDQTGFSSNTPFVANLGAGLNAYVPNLPGTGTLENPFPNGFLQATRNTAGLKTYVGRAVSYVDPDYVVPRVHQFQVGFQYELPWKSTLEASYVGSRTRDWRVSQAMNVVPLDQQQKALGNANYFNQTVANPYYGATELVGTTLNTPNVPNAQLMLPYPQFTGVTQLGIPLGWVSYNSLETRYNKRLSNGLMFSVSYTYAKYMSATAFRNNWDPLPQKTADVYDVPHHLSLAAFWDLPVGRGRLLGKTWGGVPDRILGNWRLNWTVEKIVGYPIPMPGIVLQNPLANIPGDGRLWQTCSQLLNGTRFNCASPNEPVYWRQPNYNEILTYSQRWAQVREPTRATWNISLFKGIPIKERISAEIRAEAFNAFNTPQYSAPNTSLTNQFFGRIIQDQWNYPRNMQFAARIIF